MKSPTIYKCTKNFVETWWIPLEKAGLIVERAASRGIVKLAKAKIAVEVLEDGYLMIVFSAPLVFWGKNLRLAKQVHEFFLPHIIKEPDNEK